jgi:AI-2 transport protein TqsA
MSISRTAYLFIIAIASVVTLVFLKDMLIPFVLAVIIWFIIREVQSLTRKLTIKGRAIPRWLSGVLAFLFIFGMLGLVVKLLVDNINGISAVIPVYEKNIGSVIRSIDSQLGIDLLEQARELSGDIEFAGVLSSLLNSITTILGNAFLIIIYVIFLMLEQRFFRTKFNALYTDPMHAERAGKILNDIDHSLGRYVSLKSFVSLLTGGLSYAALQIIGVDFAFFWAFLIFTLNFIPNIGSLIATLFPTIVAAIQFGDLTPALYVIAAVGTIQLVIGNVVEPRLFGDSLNISSLVVILSLAFWGAIWGIVGMILSVPITVMMILIFAQFESTRSVAILLSDKGQV